MTVTTLGPRTARAQRPRMTQAQRLRVLVAAAQNAADDTGLTEPGARAMYAFEHLAAAVLEFADEMEAARRKPEPVDEHPAAPEAPAPGQAPTQPMPAVRPEPALETTEPRPGEQAAEPGSVPIPNPSSTPSGSVDHAERADRAGVSPESKRSVPDPSTHSNGVGTESTAGPRRIDVPAPRPRGCHRAPARRGPLALIRGAAAVVTLLFLALVSRSGHAQNAGVSHAGRHAPRTAPSRHADTPRQNQPAVPRVGAPRGTVRPGPRHAATRQRRGRRPLRPRTRHTQPLDPDHQG